MSKQQEKYEVEGEEGGKFSVRCLLDHFGNPVTEKTVPRLKCDFVSGGWPTEKDAVRRIKDHLAEHEGGKPVELSETAANRGLDQ